MHWLAGQPEASAVTELRYPVASVLVVGGVPGAGKSTLMARLLSARGPAVLDSETVRARYGRFASAPVLGRVLAPFVRLEHLARIVVELWRRRTSALHLRSTGSRSRRLVAAAARLRRRPCHLIFLEVEREVAERGQRARGRKIAAHRFAREWHRSRDLRSRLVNTPPDHDFAAEGLDSCVVLDRHAANRLHAITFEGEAGSGLRSRAARAPSRRRAASR